MPYRYLSRFFIVVVICAVVTHPVAAQGKLKSKYNGTGLFAGIEVGAKGVKMSLIEINKNPQSTVSYTILKDTAINTDFISFTAPSFHNTLIALYDLYASAIKEYKVMPRNVFAVISSGVKVQADKENKTIWLQNLTDSFKIKTRDEVQHVSVIDVQQEALLSHLGIVPEDKRYNTFLIDIGSGNTKGGYFPFGNTSDFKLFQLTWGTKSMANATEKKCGSNKTLTNFEKQLTRVADEAEHTEIIYSVNASGSYPKTDIIAFSGGIAWSVATLMHPELINNQVIPVTYADVEKFYGMLAGNFSSSSDIILVKNITDNNLDKIAITNEIKKVHQVFDQRSLMAGTTLLLKIMRQFESVNDKKEFFLVKNGQVGWISAYVDKYMQK